MLDTNAVSALMRAPAGGLARRMAGLAEPVSVSVVVAAELRYGAARKGEARLSEAVERVLETLHVEPLEPPADQVYGWLRARLEREGVTLSANDLLIAAHALTLDRALVTADTAFVRVPRLAVETWAD